MKAVLRAAALLLATIIGLWSLGHGIAIAVGMRMMPGEHTDIFRHIVNKPARFVEKSHSSEYVDNMITMFDVCEQLVLLTSYNSCGFLKIGI